MLKMFELKAKKAYEEPYVLHVWGPGIAYRKTNEGCVFPTVILRCGIDSPNFLLLEAVQVDGPSFLTYAPNNKTSRVYTREALRCFYDDSCRVFGGSVYCDETDKSVVIAHCLKETSQCG